MLKEQKLEIKKEYMSVDALAAHWNVELEDIRYLGEEGKLTICLRRIPVEVAIESLLNKKPYSENPKRQRELLKMMDDPQPLHRTDIYLLFANRGCEKIKITRFQTMPVMRLVKIITPNILAGFDDMIVMASEIARFEFEVMGRIPKNTSSPLVLLAPDFTRFMLYGETVEVGDKQALVIKYLYDQYHIGNIWVHGKDMMRAAGSECLKPSNLFSKHPNWKKVIVAGRRGYYRINLPYEEPLPVHTRANDEAPSLFDFMNK